MKKKIAKHKHILLATLIGVVAIIALLYLMGRTLLGEI
jgi:hypothetical protein